MTNLQDFLQSITFPGERFLPVNNFAGRFWISDHGRLVSFNKRLKCEYIVLSPAIGDTGYYATSLRMKPVHARVRIHVLVGEHFCPMVKQHDTRMSWNHIDGNKLNNHYTNLEYITSAENIKHAVDTGLMNLKGENHPHRKMTNEKVKGIYALRGSGKSSTDIGKLFGLGRRQTSDILNGKAWQHITSRLP